MAIGGPSAGAPRGRDTSRGAAGRYAFVLEVARGYLGTLWIAHDPADASDRGTAFVRHIAPIAMTNVRAALLEAVRWGQGAKLPHSPATFELVEGKTSLDVVISAPEGELLRTVLRTVALKHVPAEPALLLGIARSLLMELHALHQHAAATSSKHGFGGVHPDSVFIDTSGHVQLFDVGSSAATSAREPWHSDPQRMGYFAPEQLETRGVPDARTDVFAVGVMLWEALTNRRLFPGNDAKTVRERLQKGPIARLDATRTSASPGIATPISNVVARALERDPAPRF
jgi:serine/threonine-protein kinase